MSSLQETVKDLLGPELYRLATQGTYLGLCVLADNNFENRRSWTAGPTWLVGTHYLSMGYTIDRQYGDITELCSDGKKNLQMAMVEKVCLYHSRIFDLYRVQNGSVLRNDPALRALVAGVEADPNLSGWKQ